jgi:hypothetical protein
MKLPPLFLTILYLSVFNVLLAESKSYIQTKLDLFASYIFTSTPNAGKLVMRCDNIFIVIGPPGERVISTKSLVTAFPSLPAYWSGKAQLTLKNEIVNLISCIWKLDRFFFDAED